MLCRGRLINLVAAVLVGCSLCTLSGCHPTDLTTDSRKQSLQSRLDSLRNETAGAQQAVLDQAGLLQTLQERFRAEQAGLHEYNSGVEAYMLQHKMAVAALVAGVAGSVSWLDSNSEFSQDARDTAAAVTILAVLWAATHMDEVSEVLATLNRADAHVHGLQAAINQTSDAITQQQGNLRDAQARFVAVNAEADTVKAQIAQM